MRSFDSKGKRADLLLAKASKAQRAWDGRGASPPSQRVIVHARRFLCYCLSYDLEPDRVAPSVRGGVGLTFENFVAHGVYIEFRNSGGIYVVNGLNLKEPDIYEVSIGNLESLALKLANGIIAHD